MNGEDSDNHLIFRLANEYNSARAEIGSVHCISLWGPVFSWWNDYLKYFYFSTLVFSTSPNWLKDNLKILPLYSLVNNMLRAIKTAMFNQFPMKGLLLETPHFNRGLVRYPHLQRNHHRRSQASTSQSFQWSPWVWPFLSWMGAWYCLSAR